MSLSSNKRRRFQFGSKECDSVKKTTKNESIDQSKKRCDHKHEHLPKTKLRTKTNELSRLGTSRNGSHRFKKWEYHINESIDVSWEPESNNCEYKPAGKSCLTDSRMKKKLFGMMRTSVTAATH